MPGPAPHIKESTNMVSTRDAIDPSVISASDYSKAAFTSFVSSGFRPPPQPGLYATSAGQLTRFGWAFVSWWDGEKWYLSVHYALPLTVATARSLAGAIYCGHKFWAGLKYRPVSVRGHLTATGREYDGSAPK